MSEITKENWVYFKWDKDTSNFANVNAKICNKKFKELCMYLLGNKIWITSYNDLKFINMITNELIEYMEKEHMDTKVKTDPSDRKLRPIDSKDTRQETDTFLEVEEAEDLPF